ncbi:hypothetical protein X801_00412 [Opisthorchis viverrini]|uniref:RabBD domain-containing protein n=1 Tax=Opisthorchis viverrini TaxID=6198 RepID=A0A1S8XAG2_OPIVI|nr:hypothetical protein X801_00412 [Opisthorchis viverrini]
MGNELSQSGEPGNPSDHISYETASILFTNYRKPLDDNGCSIPYSQDVAITGDDQSRTCSDNRRNQAITAEAEKQANEMCLTDEEKDHINHVLSRVRRLEEQEESRILEPCCEKPSAAYALLLYGSSYWYFEIPVVSLIERPQNALETFQEASALAVPETRSECHWLRKNLQTFK